MHITALAQTLPASLPSSPTSQAATSVAPSPRSLRPNMSLSTTNTPAAVVRQRGRRVVLSRPAQQQPCRYGSSGVTIVNANDPFAYSPLALNTRHLQAQKLRSQVADYYGVKQDSVPFPPLYFSESNRLPSSTSSSSSSSEESSPPPSAGATSPIIRRKTGEIVKPCLKPSIRSLSCDSLPTTASSSMMAHSAAKFVHFGVDLEQVRFFLKAETPEHVCRDPDFSEAEAEIRALTPLQSAPSKTLQLRAISGPSPMFSAYEHSPVVFESLWMSDGAIRGEIKVHNIDYQKQVRARYTIDTWKTVHEAGASFQSQIVGPDGGRCGVDRFTFSIQLTDMQLEKIRGEPQTLAICVYYKVQEKEFWDNNGGSNYRFSVFYNAPSAAGGSRSAGPKANSDFASSRIRSASDTALPSLTFNSFGLNPISSMVKQNGQPRGSEGLLKPTAITFSAPKSTAGGSSSGPKTTATNSAASSFRFASPNDTKRYMELSEAMFSSPGPNSTTTSAKSTQAMSSEWFTEMFTAPTTSSPQEAKNNAYSSGASSEKSFGGSHYYNAGFYLGDDHYADLGSPYLYASSGSYTAHKETAAATTTTEKSWTSLPSSKQEQMISCYDNSYLSAGHSPTAALLC
ncbi:hypothetical protein H4219_002363 [Mycoemilia scoparia]|uniref:CBM21 domain-containing protein n=1 Tax=Mycoemilia scoparia TaxID=417184 RepID=A0A9W8A1C9_9FUNG|nr:hypothetical protein H4219_002363 [Mycoemilia scoparia]